MNPKNYKFWIHSSEAIQNDHAVQWTYNMAKFKSFICCAENESAFFNWKNHKQNFSKGHHTFWKCLYYTECSILHRLSLCSSPKSLHKSIDLNTEVQPRQDCFLDIISYNLKSFHPYNIFREEIADDGDLCSNLCIYYLEVNI